MSQYYWPESFRINEVVESLLCVGCRVTVLTGQPNCPQGDVFEGYSAAGFAAQRHEAGYNICRVPLLLRGRGGAFGLVTNYLTFVLSASLLGPWLLRKQRFDVVFVYAPSPVIQAIPAVWLAFIKRAKLVTWVQDLWPQSMEATGFKKDIDLLAACYSFTHVLRPSNNLGYFDAFNFYFQSQFYSNAEFVIICNIDLVFEQNFVDKLISQTYKEYVFVVCPDVITLDGIHQNPHVLKPRNPLQRVKLDLYFSHYFLAYFLRLVQSFFQLLFPKKKSYRHRLQATFTWA